MVRECDVTSMFQTDAVLPLNLYLQEQEQEKNSEGYGPVPEMKIFVLFLFLFLLLFSSTKHRFTCQFNWIIVYQAF